MSEHAETASHRLGTLMHQLHGVTGPSPEDIVGIDLPHRQLRALFIVAKHGPMPVGRLADATDASIASTSSLAERLVRSGHVRREADPSDRRVVLLVVTEHGRETVDQLEAHFHARFERLVEAMTPAGRDALEAGLTDLVRAADELGLRTHPDHHGGAE